MKRRRRFADQMAAQFNAGKPGAKPAFVMNAARRSLDPKAMRNAAKAAAKRAWPGSPKKGDK